MVAGGKDMGSLRGWQAMWFSLPFGIRHLSWYVVGEPAPPAVHASFRNARLRLYRTKAGSLPGVNTRQGLRALMAECGYDKSGILV
jgi:hypothetical protein